jgi:spore maturation protein A
MVGVIWTAMLVAGVAFAAASGHVGSVTTDVSRAAGSAVATALDLAAVMALWLGLVRIAERAGAVQFLVRAVHPVVRRLFPTLAPDGEALRWIELNVSANLLGLGSAATPFGLKAMAAMQKENPTPQRATPAMCTFLALNTTSLTLLPSTLIALRALYGSRSPAAIVLPTLGATLVATTVALSVDALLRFASGATAAPPRAGGPVPPADVAPPRHRARF